MTVCAFGGYQGRRWDDMGWCCECDGVVARSKGIMEENVRV